MPIYFSSVQVPRPRRKRRLLGQANSSGVYLQSTPAQLQAAIKAAQNSGIVQGVNDPGTLTALYNAGADPVQLALAATNARLSASSTIQSDLQTVNQDVGASNYAGAYGVTDVGSVLQPSSDGSSWLAIGAIALAGVLGVGLLLRR